MQARGFILIAVCVLTLAAGTSVVLRAEPQEEQSKADLEKELQRLLHERVATAESAVEAMQAAFKAQTVTLDVLIDAANKLVEARLAVATTPAQEIDLLNEHLQLMQGIEKRTKALYDIGARGGEIRNYLAAKIERQSAQIALIQARLKVNR